MFRRLLLALALCAGLFAAAVPAPTRAAAFGVAASVPQSLDPPAIAVRGGAHWRHFWRVYRRRHGLHRRHLYRHRHHRRWHPHRSGGHGRLHFTPERDRDGREAAPAPKASPKSTPRSSAPTLY